MSNYGQESSDANYFDDVSESQEQAQFDPSKFVPVDKYQELEQKFNETQPKLQILDRLGQAFNPDPVSQYTPEQIAEFQRISQVAQASLNPQIQTIQQQNQVVIDELFSSTIQKLNFEDEIEAESWMFESQRRLAKSSDPQAKQHAQTLSQLYNSGNKLALAKYCEKHFDILDAHAGPMKRGISQRQQIGHSFNNSPFSNSNQLSPQEFERQVSELVKANKYDEARELQKRFASQIQSLL